MLGNLRAHLGGVAVDGLASGDDEVIVELAEGGGNGVGSGESVGAAELAVAEPDGAVHPHGVSLAEDSFGLRRSHGDDRHVGAVFIFETQGELQASLVVGIHDGGHAVANERSFYGVKLDFSGVRHLLDTYYYIHFSCCSYLII